MYCIELHHEPIEKQLQLEQRLLRQETASFCIINRGSPRTIVLGISGQPELLLDLGRVRADGVPVIRRFSGGGTVIVDEGTFFVTLILSEEDMPGPFFPEPILRFGEALYRDSWNIEGFHLRENDYVIGEKKCGGNAQYIQRRRCLQHTSFLWDYQDKNMEYLLLPPKRPQYRGDRLHGDFLCRLQEYVSTQDELVAQLKHALEQRFTLN